MTPELRKACEVVFQEHKLTPSIIVWKKETFLERLTWGLREMAKETLLQKRVIEFPNKSKRNHTILAVAARPASNFEEAITMVLTGKAASAVVIEKPVDVVKPVLVVEPVKKEKIIVIPALKKPDYPKNGREIPKYIYVQQGRASLQEMTVPSSKWYLSKVWYYILWPLTAAVGGAAIAYLLGALASVI